MSVLRTTALLPILLGMSLMAGPLQAAETPNVGEKAKDFRLPSVDGDIVTLSEMVKKGPVVLIVLRGYPGYQCPICDRQVADLMKHADEFKDAGANVILVYPGPNDALQSRAEEFLNERTLPAPITMVIDPAYNFTNSYGLRWDEPRETSYPSSFLIDKNMTVQFAHVSKTHGNRTDTKALLSAVRGLSQ